MSRRIDLHETPQKRLARIMQAQDARLGRLETRPTGVKHLGEDGDVVWDGPEVVAGEGGAPVEGETWQTWSVRDVAREASSARIESTGAVASANGKNARIYSQDPATGTTNPASGMPLATGDTWWQYAPPVEGDPSSRYRIVGSWFWDGTAWQPETLTDAVLGSLDVNKLTVVGVADVNELVAEAIATKQIEAALLRTPVSAEGFWAVMDSFGFRVIDDDGGPEGTSMDLIRLGPDLDKLLQLGSGQNMVSINSAGGITGHTGTFAELWVDGRPISGGDPGPAGIVAYGQLFGGYSRQLRARDQVMGLEADLRRGRVYELYTNGFTVRTENVNVIPFPQLHYTLDGTYPGADWTASAVAESIIGPFGGFRTMTPMSRLVDLRNEAEDKFMRAGISLAEYGTNGWCQVAATVNPCTITVKDWGTSLPDRGTPYYDTAGGGQQVIAVEHLGRWYATGWASYTRGGARDLSLTKPTQGQASSTNRECMFFFDSMTDELAGAVIRRITLATWADHWWHDAGGTARWHWHGYFGSIPESGQFQNFMVDTAGWPRGALRSININPDEFGAWQSGARRGFGFATADTNVEFYGQFSPIADGTPNTPTFIEVVYEK